MTKIKPSGGRWKIAGELRGSEMYVTFSDVGLDLTKPKYICPSIIHLGDVFDDRRLVHGK